MPHIIIDNQKIEFTPGQTIIQAALEHGFDVPHFCWHPGLSVAGNCRMCLCDVGMPRMNPDKTPALDEHGNQIYNFLPKLQIACATPAADGMFVKLNDKKVETAQESVMEFLLINHPLDCPICDEAGQCKLQEYGYKHSKGESRFIEAKNHKDKRRPLGPNVLFDGERCISCSRCIRYANEEAQQPVLTFVNRGDHNTIETFPGKEFDSPYSMNVIEICPVGALTSQDFRFKARVWDMSFNETICTGCARGCNINAGVRDNEILRLEPRVNMSVNEYWMCDHGRLNQYRFVNEQRIAQPMIRNNDTLRDAEWTATYTRSAELLKQFAPSEIMFFGSSRATNEDNFALVQLAKFLGSPNLDFVRFDDKSFGDEKLRRSDLAPNSTGAIAVGVKPDQGGVSVDTFVQAVQSGKIKAVMIIEDDSASLSSEHARALDTLSCVIVQASNMTLTAQKADVLLASATYAELEGTYTNFQERVQHIEPAIVTTENVARMGMKMSRLDKFGAANDRWTNGEKRNCRMHWRSITGIANVLGAGWTFKKVNDVFSMIARTYPAFDGMSYSLLDERRGILFGKAHEEYTPVFEYSSHELKPQA